MKLTQVDPRGSSARQRERAAALAHLGKPQTDAVATVLEHRARRELARRVRERGES